MKQGNSRGPKKRFVKKGAQIHTGDLTIPYVSLSYALTWLSHGDVTKEEYRPSVVHRAKHNWAPSKVASAVSIGVSVDPAASIFSSAKAKSGDSTVVIEVESVDHLEIIKHSYVQSLVFEHLLPLMEKELRLDDSALDEQDEDMLGANAEVIIAGGQHSSLSWGQASVGVGQAIEGAFKGLQNIMKFLGLS